MFGFRVKLRFALKSPYCNTELCNVTEIHWNYREGKVAFESDIHGTGMTYDATDIAEFEATLETYIAGAF